MLRSRASFLVITAGAAAAAARPVRAQALPPLRVGTAPADSFAQAWYAQELGLFSKAGLTVDVQMFNSGTAAASAVIGGSLDIAITTPIPLANAHLRGVPFVIVCSATVNTPKAPTELICVRKSGTVRQAADLVGKTAAVNTVKTLLQLGLEVYLAKSNIAMSTMKVVEMPFAEMGPAIDRGAIDAAVLTEPALSKALQKNDVRILVDPLPIISPRFVAASWFSTRQFVERNPEAVKRYVAAMYETARWANRNHKASAPILVRYTKMEPDDVDKMIRVDFAEQTRAAEYQPLLDACTKFGYLPKTVAASDLLLA
jgi:NitT/TauT family transport system substrate-binding protein